MTFVIAIEQGELVAELTRQLTERRVKDASLVLIGGVDAFTVSTMPADDATKDIVTAYPQPGELTGTGEVVDGRVHIHVVCGIEGDVAKAGHLHAATVDTFFVRVYVTEVETPRKQGGLP